MMQGATPSTRRQEWLAWLVAGLWIAVIYTSVPIMGAIRERTAGQASDGPSAMTILGIASIGVVLVGLTTVVLLARRRRGSLPLRSLLWLAGVAAVCTWWSLQLWEPVEAVHFVEYGGLGILLYRALRLRINDAAVLVAATIIGALVGTSDEILQWLVPRRYFDFRDIWLNTGAVAMAQLVLWQGMRIAEATRRPSPGSLRLVCRLLALQLLLLGCCLSMTPQRVARLAETVPLLAPLSNIEQEMAEYGHRHVVPEIGVFYSRFTIDELRRQDCEQADTVALVMERFRRPSRYERFLETYTPARAPFIHEFRVHLFSRNRNLERADEHANDPAQQRRYLSVAYRENQLLETFFPESMTRSRTFLGKRRRAAFLATGDPRLLSAQPFVSKVSAHLITAFSEGQMRGTLVLALLLLLAVDRWLGWHCIWQRREEAGP